MHLPRKKKRSCVDHKEAENTLRYDFRQLSRIFFELTEKVKALQTNAGLPRWIVRPRAVECPGVTVHEGVVGAVAVGSVAGSTPACVVVARSADELAFGGHPGRRSVVEALLESSMLVRGPGTKHVSLKMPTIRQRIKTRFLTNLPKLGNLWGCNHSWKSCCEIVRNHEKFRVIWR